MRSTLATLGLLVLLAAAGVGAGLLVRGGDDEPQATVVTTERTLDPAVLAAGERATEAAWERSGVDGEVGVSCEPLAGSDAWPLICTGTLAGDAEPSIEVVLRPGPRVAACAILGAGNQPQADCRRDAAAAL